MSLSPTVSVSFVVVPNPLMVDTIHDLQNNANLVRCAMVGFDTLIRSLKVTVIFNTNCVLSIAKHRDPAGGEPCRSVGNLATAHRVISFQLDKGTS